jgi:hypothetical protein
VLALDFGKLLADCLQPNDFAISFVAIGYILNSKLFNIGARDRNRTGTPVIHEAADFKSDVSTNSTTRARLPD